MIKNKFSARTYALVMLSGVSFLSNCKKDERVLPEDPNSSVVNLKDSLSSLAATASESSTSYNLTKALPSGYVKDGSKDYTSYIQAAINKYSNVTFPAFPILINDTGLNVGSNKVLTFPEGAKLKKKPTSRGTYKVLYISRASNVIINNAVIYGDRAKHIGSSGEYGIGIGIYSSNNITLNNPKVYDCWGDGIYIGKSSTTNTNNKNIVINNAYLRNNRRDGISIISVDGLKLVSPYAGYTNGTSPMCGINIEPNSYNDDLKNIVITNPKTEYNKGHGIQMGFTKLYGGSSKTISINILNHTDIGSTVAFKNSQYFKKRRGSETLSGIVYLTNPNWQKNSSHPLTLVYTDKNLKAKISTARVMRTSGSYLSASSAKTAIIYGITSGTSYSLTTK